MDPSEYVVILPHWGGRLSQAYGARNTSRAQTIAVVDQDSNVAVFY